MRTRLVVAALLQLAVFLSCAKQPPPEPPAEEPRPTSTGQRNFELRPRAPLELDDPAFRNLAVVNDELFADMYFKHFGVNPTIDYAYASPDEDAFSLHAEAAPSPNRTGYHVLHTGLKGKEISIEERKAANLVFVIDVSGSMDMENRLRLVKREW